MESELIMAKSPRIPPFVLQHLDCRTQREFKQLKRQQLKAVIKAYDEYRSGCGYCPGSLRLEVALELHQKQLSIKNWGR